VLLFGSRARGDARPDCVFDLLVVVGEKDAERLAGSRWHVVARALREGKELLEDIHAEVRQRMR